ncbi:MAG TPA: hypothetical protein VM597_16310 [Gemmataceae bacterium]|jgi:hypothetical protein|nr:hypothetical protein [Gemmataceae bacterium]
MCDRVWQVPREQFVAAWGGSESLDEAAAKVRALAGGPAPRWAVMARSVSLRKEGVEMKPLTAATTRTAQAA